MSGSPASARPANRYANWRKSGIPLITYSPLAFDLSRVPEQDRFQVRERCFENYKKSCASFDQSIADTAGAFVHERGTPQLGRPGPLLTMARAFSCRIYALYQAYCKYEMDQGIPMLPPDAGQLKNHGFTSPEIIQMREGCARVADIINELAAGKSQENREYLFRVLTSPDRRKQLKEMCACNPVLLKAIKKYEALQEKDLIDRACFMMFRFGNMSVGEVELQLDAIAQIRPHFRASLDERVLMEIRHRVAGDGRGANYCPGSIGSNPLAYQNLILRGEPGNPESEFRTLFYFVYMNNHFVNMCMQDPAFIPFANDFLRQSQADWRLDPEFIDAMNARDPKFLPPVFRYGENANLNRQMREYFWDPTFYQRQPNPLLAEVVDGRCSPDASFRFRLSPRELMNQIGDFKFEAIAPHRKIAMASGGSFFRIKRPEEIEDSPEGRAAKAYLKMVSDLGLPSLSSISGTFDQMAAMGGFVGVVLEPSEIETLKVAMIAFMVPARDHSVDEILQSALSYHQPYTPGPGFERYVYPSQSDRFMSLLDQEVQRRGERAPTYYLTAECAERVFK